VLPAAFRLVRREEFSSVLRHGRRMGRTLVVMHVLVPDGPVGELSPRVGLVVSKAVGGSVVRHRVARRLRHVMRDRLSLLPAGSRVVIRALPRSATAESARLGVEVDRALRVLLPAPATQPTTPSAGASGEASERT
jgi:ribonuclease P protein component